jgi:hypothetical protein
MMATSIKERLFRQKCLNELAFYLNWRDLRQLPCSVEARDLSAFVVGNCSSDYLEWACRRPEQSLLHAQTFAHMVRHGRWDTATADLLRGLLSGRFSWHTELLACRQLDLLVACRQADVAAPIDAAAAIAASSMALPPCPLLSDDEAFYSFTHTVGHAYLLQTHAFAPSNAAIVALEGGMCRAIATGDLDLALELLLCQIVSGASLESAALQVYAALTDGLQDGVLSETSRQSSALRDFLAERPQETWAYCFHLMLLAALVLTALEACPRRDGLPPADDDGFVLAYGRCANHLQRHRIVAGLAEAAQLVPLGRRQRCLIRGIDEHVVALRNPDGSFGRFFDERRLYEANVPGGRFSDVRAPVQSACLRHLACSTVSPIDQGAA